MHCSIKSSQFIFGLAALALSVGTGCKPRTYNTSETQTAQGGCPANADLGAVEKYIAGLDGLASEVWNQGQVSAPAAVIFAYDTYREKYLNQALKASFSPACANGKFLGIKENGPIAILMSQKIIPIVQRFKTGEVGPQVNPIQKLNYVIEQVMCIRNLISPSECGVTGRIPTYIPNEGPDATVFKPSTTLSDSAGNPKQFGSLVDNNSFTWLVGKTKASLVGSNLVLDNPEDRYPMLAKATHVASWKIYPDTYGTAAAKAIKASGAQVLVDRNMANPATNATTAILGANLKTWGNLAFTYHKKYTILSDNSVIFGGKNYGDQYIQNTNGLDDWDDTDIMIRNTGVAKEARTMFAADLNNSSNYISPANPCTPTMDKTCFAFISHNPSLENKDEILSYMINSIKHAKKSIQITNAYVINFHPFVKALTEHLTNKDGVTIEILTNSQDSVDEKGLSIPMELHAKELFQFCQDSPTTCKIYLKNKGQTSTLHSKYMIIDGTTAIVGSYNIHPQSRVLAAELVGVLRQHEMGANAPVTALTEMFKQDINNATAVSSQYLQVKTTIEPAVKVLMGIFYDML